jgi:SP family myo-inositol transporter-like MFS transporter 13
MYIAEVSPAKYRGRMIGLDNMSITGGQLISYGIGAAFASTRGGWRYMVGGGAIPAIVLCALLPFCPESPRQLIYHGKEDEAKDVIRKIYPNGTEEQVNQKCEHIRIHIEISKQMTEGKSQWWVFKQLYVVPANFRALVSACGLMAISQLGGFNSLMYYSSTLFALVGFSDPVAVGTVIAGTNFFFTWVNLMLVDRVGRRRILLVTMPFMGLALILAAIAFHWIPQDWRQCRHPSKVGSRLHGHLCWLLFLRNGEYSMAQFRVLPDGDSSHGNDDVNHDVLGL